MLANQQKTATFFPFTKDICNGKLHCLRSDFVFKKFIDLQDKEYWLILSLGNNPLLFLSTTWLPHSQLWSRVEVTATLIQCNLLHFTLFHRGGKNSIFDVAAVLDPPLYSVLNLKNLRNLVKPRKSKMFSNVLKDFCS